MTGREWGRNMYNSSTERSTYIKSADKLRNTIFVTSEVFRHNVDVSVE